MQRTHWFASLALTAALAAPVAITAAAATPQEVKVRVYDSEHKDYHNWDDHEQAAWGRYLQEKHLKEHEYKAAKKSEQADYWRWRHAHPD